MNSCCDSLSTVWRGVNMHGGDESGQDGSFCLMSIYVLPPNVCAIKKGIGRKVVVVGVR